jgi:hypothetical protein
MLDTLKSWAAWLWNWITVITVAVVSFLYYGLDLASSFLHFVGVDAISPVIGAERAVFIMGVVGIAKGGVTWWQDRQQKKQAAEEG